MEKENSYTGLLVKLDSEKVDARLILLSGQQTKSPISVENQFIHPTSTIIQNKYRFSMEWRNKNPLNTKMM